MRKIIDEKLYNTKTAELIHKWDNGYYTNDSSFCSQDLYRSAEGHYFLYGKGRISTQYAIRDTITPITFRSVRSWLKEHK